MATSRTTYTEERAPIEYGRTPSYGLWPAIFAGFFCAILAFWIVFTLGVAIGGHSLDAISRDQIDGLSLGAAIWTFASAVIGCFVGGFFCSRFTSHSTWRAGIAEGLVVSSLFFLFLTIQSSTGIGLIGKGVAGTASMMTGTAASLAQRPEVQNVMNETLADMNLRSDPTQVAEGVAARMIRGDRESAVNYLAYQSGLTRGEVEQRINEVSANITRAADELKDKAGSAMAAMGWSLFLTALVGSIACCIGAGLGARMNATSLLTSPTGRRQASYA